jgi:bifunctional NMN adenylyltransferase/nudix hydrolase
MINNPVGVIVGRFQVPFLHDGHRWLIKKVAELSGGSQNVLILVGTTDEAPNSRNALPFHLVHDMLHEFVPKATIGQIADVGTNEYWSQVLDLTIEQFFPGRQARLFGARDSFLSVYNGKYPTLSLDSPYPPINGSAFRKACKETLRYSEDFRAGIIWAACNKHPISYQTVDIALICGNESKSLLLGKRKGEDKFRFIGGFVDPAKDLSLEEAAARETKEETGLSFLPENFQYIGSHRVQDYRYRNCDDKILTSLMVTFCSIGAVWGIAEAKDDLQNLSLFDPFAAVDHIVDEHINLLYRLNRYLGTFK